MAAIHNVVYRLPAIAAKWQNKHAQRSVNRLLSGGHITIFSCEHGITVYILLCAIYNKNDGAFHSLSLVLSDV